MNWLSKEGNCFVGGSFQALDRLADTLCDEHAIGRLTKVCDRWAYSSCLCFALDLDEQRRLAGVDLRNPRIRAVAEALRALAPAPGGFTLAELAQAVR